MSGPTLGSNAFVRREQIYAEMRKAIARAGGQTAWAREIGTTPQQISDTLSARRDPCGAVLEALGLEKTTLFFRRRSRAETSRPSTAGAIQPAGDDHGP